MFSNTAGEYNTADGYFSLNKNTTGSRNVGNGYLALFENTTGSDNVASGSSAGRYLADGVTNNTITNESIYLGANTRSNLDNQTNQIVIGFGTIGNGSNTTTIGNNSTTNTYLRGTLNLSDLPTSSAGLSTGDIWNNSGVLNIV